MAAQDRRSGDNCSCSAATGTRGVITPPSLPPMSKHLNSQQTRGKTKESEESGTQGPVWKKTLCPHCLWALQHREGKCFCRPFPLPHLPGQGSSPIHCQCPSLHPVCLLWRGQKAFWWLLHQLALPYSQAFSQAWAPAWAQQFLQITGSLQKPHQGALLLCY